MILIAVMLTSVVASIAAYFAYLRGKVLLGETWRFLWGKPKEALVARDWSSAARLMAFGSDDKDEKFASSVHTFQFWTPFSIALWMTCFLLSHFSMDTAANVALHVARLGTASIVVQIYIEVTTYIPDRRWHASYCSSRKYRLESGYIARHASTCVGVVMGAIVLNLIIPLTLGLSHGESMPTVLFLLLLFAAAKAISAALDVVIRYEGRECRCA